MKTKIILFLLTTVFLLQSSFSQNTLSLSFESAIDYALKNNKTITNAKNSVEESQLKVRETISKGLPQVDAKIDYSNYFNSSASIGPMNFTFNPTSNLNVSLGQLIFSGSYIIGIQMANIMQDMSEVSKIKTEAEIKSQVMNTYYLALVIGRMKEIMQKSIKNMQEVYDKTSAFVKTGILEETDKDRIQVQLSMLNNNMKAVERQEELAYNLLRLQLGVSADTKIELTGNLWEILAQSQATMFKDTTFVLTKNPDYQLLSLQNNIVRKQISLEAMSFTPTITGFYNHLEKIKKAELDFSPKNVIGFNVSIPIFSSGTRYLKYSQAKIRFENSKNQMEMFTDQLMVQEKQLRFNLKNNYEQYLIQKENVELAKKVYNNTTIKYNQGMVSSIDLITTNGNYLQAENSYVSSILQLLESKTALEKLLMNNF